LKLERNNAFSSICQATPVVAYFGHRMNTQCIGLSEEVLMSLFLFLFFFVSSFSHMDVEHAVVAHVPASNSG
jgi:uncharacterized membrane protein